MISHAPSLVQKPTGQISSDANGGQPQSRKRNPFLPYEKSLHVADITDSHVLILNKFCVTERHAIIVTRGANCFPSLFS